MGLPFGGVHFQNPDLCEQFFLVGVTLGSFPLRPLSPLSQPHIVDLNLPLPFCQSHNYT